MINISELINDPDFCQPNGVNITRKKVTSYSDFVPVNETKNLNVIGIITIADENSDEMLDEGNRNTEAIHIFTYERLKTVGIDKIDGFEYLADIVHFNGNDYEVIKCLDDAQYGFCRSTAIKIRQDTT